MTKGLWKRFLALVPLALVLVLVSRAHIRAVGGTYVAQGFVPHERTLTKEDVRLDHAGVVEVTSVERGVTGIALVTFRAVGDGEAMATVVEGDMADTWQLRVEDGTIIEGGINFSGWESIHMCLVVFLVALCALFLSVLVRVVRRAWYGYTMVACGGGLLFSVFQLAFFLMLMVRSSLRSFSDLAFELAYMADWFVMLSLLPMAVLALLVSLSNVALIRREGMRPVNLLGIAVSVVWAAVNLFWYHSSDLIYSMFSSFDVMRVVDTLTATAISFGECLLLSTIICAWLASRHVPKHGADYLVVLGCGIRADGTPSPLLAGRVDRALAFGQMREGMGDVPATFVPSGGQGPDEVMSEAQSMANYLVAKGVAENRIVLEDRSTTTNQNMRYSREVIERHAQRDVSELSVVFSTTNYHVFRGYVCAHQAGMAVEGLGAKTRAYFWPNAFLREFVGLLAVRWKAILLAYASVAVIYGIAAYALTLA